MLRNNYRYMNEAGDDGGDGGGGVVETPAADAGAPTLIDSPTIETPQDAGTFSDTWRADMAGDNDKSLKALERYGSPKDVANALMAAQNKIRSGELTSKLPDDPSEAELADYRKEHGIPGSAKDYTTDLGNGIVIGDEDKVLVDSFLESALGSNMNQQQVDGTLKAYFDIRTQQEEAQAESDNQYRMESEDALRAEWGTEFRRNPKLIHNFLNGKMDEDAKDALLSGRLADGTMIGNNPAILSAFLGMALQANPTGTITPAGGGDISDTINGEIATIEATMRDNRAAYNGDEKMQARYRELLGFKENMK